MLSAVVFALAEIYLSILGAFLKKSKTMFIIIGVFIWIYIAFSLDSSDIANYRYAYNHDIYLGKDPLFYVIEKFFMNKSFCFDLFKILLGTLITCIFCVAICRYTENISILIAICLLIPAGSFATQIRSGLAGALIIYAIGFLKKGNKIALLEYILVVILSAFIHQMALFYLVLIIPWIIKNNNKYINIFLKLVVVSTLVILILPGIIDKVVNVLYYISKSEYVSVFAFRLNQMFSEEYKATFIGFSFNALHQIVVYYCVEKSLYNYLRIAKDDLPFGEIESIQFHRAISCTFLALIPFYSISFHFVRVFYYALPFLYAQTINATQKTREYIGNYRYGRNRIFLMFGMTMFVFLFGIYQEPADFLRVVNGIFKW